MFFVALCFMYGPLTKGKSSRFIKNYNYLAFISLCILSLLLNSYDVKTKNYILVVFIWLGYVGLLTLLDDLKIINLYK